MCAMIVGMLPTLAYAAQPTEPKNIDGVYQIASAENLQWFQQQVKSGKTAINAALTANIDLTSIEAWSAIPAYAGTFD